MKYLKPDSAVSSVELDTADSESKALLESQLLAIGDRLRESAAADAGGAARLMLEKGRTLLRLDRKLEAWQEARTAFDQFVAIGNWEGAIEAGEVLFLSEQPQSIAALGQSVWLAVTFPVNPELTVAMLQHIVDETDDEADGAAVAAVTAHYVVDMRAEAAAKEDLSLFTARMLATVARRHSRVEEQSGFDAWMERLELNDPAKFLVRLRNVVDVMVQDDWWFDREALQQRLPVN